MTVLNLSEDMMSDEIKKPKELEQAADSSTPLSEQELKNDAEQIASVEAPLSEEELNKVAGGVRAGGDKVKYME
jgi:hypothetical protein